MEKPLTIATTKSIAFHPVNLIPRLQIQQVSSEVFTGMGSCAMVHVLMNDLITVAPITGHPPCGASSLRYSVNTLDRALVLV